MRGRGEDTLHLTAIRILKYLYSLPIFVPIAIGAELLHSPRLLAELRVPYLDLTPRFREVVRMGDTVYLRVDGQWNANGHALAAALAAPLIESVIRGTATPP